MEHYGKLAALDYKIYIRPCSEEDYPSCNRKKGVPYFYGTTLAELDPEEQVLVSYEVIFTPAYLKDKPHSSLWKEDIGDYSNANLFMKRYAYYPAFVGAYDPSTMKVGCCLDDEDSCNGKVCVYETGLWCRLCHGEFEENIEENFAYFIQDLVYMSEFPFQSILEIRKKTEPLPKDFKPRKYLRKLEKKALKLEKIKQELQTWDTETQRLLQELLSDREKRKQTLLSCVN
jgi:hypothetical protein